LGADEAGLGSGAAAALADVAPEALAEAEAAEEAAGAGAEGADAGADAGVVEAGAAEGGVGAGGLGAETPAVLEPRPSFWRLGALSLPLGSMPLSDWNFCMAEMVLASHLPVG